MLKKISIEHLILGMYVHAFCGSWMEHPFWKTKFVLKDPKDLERIRDAAISEVWIDSSRGLDIQKGIPSISDEACSAHGDGACPTHDAQACPHSPVVQVVSPPAVGTGRLAPSSMQNELRVAASICGQAKTAMISMFSESRMGKIVNAENAHHLVEEITDSVTRNPGALISLARLKTADDYTYMHSVAVCALMVALAKQLKLDEKTTQQAGMAGLLHDLGKSAIPLEVLNKPGKLTDEEFDLVKDHPRQGYLMLKDSASVEPDVLDACLHHHEKMDGTGYPDKLKGEQISLLSRMAAICDVYDAITSDRPYKRGWDPAESVKRMAEWTKGHFDPRIFHAFVKSIGVYPVGSLVRMGSGKIGVVVEQGQQSLTSPKVRLFFSTKSGLRISPILVDLSDRHCIEKIVSREDPDKWHFPDLNELWSGIAEIAH